MARASSHISKTSVVAGGFKEITDVKFSYPGMDISLVQATHEKTDIRLILHCINTDAETFVVSARDNDVFVLIIAHFNKMQYTQQWMKADISKKP